MKLALLGYGKMGRAIEKLATEAGDEVVMRIDVDNKEALTAENIRRADVAIEFSHPEVAYSHIHFCLQQGVPIVSGTTGWLERLSEIEALCREKQGAFFYASNFSVGVNLFFAANRYLARLMNHWPAFDVGVSEWHHRFKQDAPSGTALTMVEDILAEVERKENWVPGPTTHPSELGVISGRLGHIPGTHTVQYESEVDTIILQHTARSREGFAQGALQAARWLVGKQGMFGMADLLGLDAEQP